MLTGIRPRSPFGTTSLHPQSSPESSLEAGQPTVMSLHPQSTPESSLEAGYNHTCSAGRKNATTSQLKGQP